MRGIGSLPHASRIHIWFESVSNTRFCSWFCFLFTYYIYQTNFLLFIIYYAWMLSNIFCLYVIFVYDSYFQNYYFRILNKCPINFRKRKEKKEIVVFKSTQYFWHLICPFVFVMNVVWICSEFWRLIVCEDLNWSTVQLFSEICVSKKHFFTQKQWMSI